jgi:hypothetical protein
MKEQQLRDSENSLIIASFGKIIMGGYNKLLSVDFALYLRKPCVLLRWKRWCRLTYVFVLDCFNDLTVKGKVNRGRSSNALGHCFEILVHTPFSLPGIMRNWPCS